jgi:hypothetical protein
MDNKTIQNKITIQLRRESLPKGYHFVRHEHFPDTSEHALDTVNYL